jgi:hypothetical protein
MRTLGLGLAVLGLAATTLAAPAGAFHGAAWRLEGTASLGPVSFDVTVTFSGFLFLNKGTFSIEYFDPVTHSIFHKNTIMGGLVFAEQEEDCIVTRTMDTDGVAIPFTFDLHAIKRVDTCAGQVLEEHTDGHYLVFELHFDDVPPGLDA